MTRGANTDGNGVDIVTTVAAVLRVEPVNIPTVHQGEAIRVRKRNVNDQRQGQKRDQGVGRDLGQDH